MLQMADERRGTRRLQWAPLGCARALARSMRKRPLGLPRALPPHHLELFGTLRPEIIVKLFAHVSTAKRVDRSPSFSYTCGVVQSPLGLVVKGKSSSPEQIASERGFGRAAEMGRQPRKAA